MKLQVALDFFTTEDALALMKLIHPYVDIIELGSPLMYAEGFSAIKVMKEEYPDKLVLADMKIVDGGYDIGLKAYEAGADIVITIAMTNDDTLKGLVKAAHELGKYAMVDAIGVTDLDKRVLEAEEMGFDYILLHTAHDTLGDDVMAPVRDLARVKKNVKHARVGISGGITVAQMPGICGANPDWVVVGSGITCARDPLNVTREIAAFK